MLFLTGTLDKPQASIINNQLHYGILPNSSSVRPSDGLVTGTSDLAKSQKRDNPSSQSDSQKDRTPSEGAADTKLDSIEPFDKPKSSPLQVYRKKGNFPEEKQKIIAHASRISNNDLDFIATLDKENAGTWDVNITSKKNKNGTYDKGLCQLNSQYYSHLYKDKNWKNPEWQVNRCWELYSAWKKLKILHKRFFAYPKRHASKLNFELTQ